MLQHFAQQPMTLTVEPRMTVHEDRDLENESEPSGGLRDTGRTGWGNVVGRCREIVLEL